MAVFDMTIKDYLTEIDEAPLLSWEDECKLAQLISDYDDPQAREQFVRSNLRLVVNIAKKFTSPRLPLADLIEEGNLGLIRAVDSFDAAYGVRFSTYAAWWIKQGIKRALLLDSGPISIPTYMVELINHYRHTFAELSSKFEQSPSLAQIAKEMKLSVKKVKAISQVADSVNSSLQTDSDDVNLMLEQDPAQITNQMPSDELTNAEELGKLVAMLEDIDSREAKILTLRFGIGGKEPLTLKQIGAKLSLTRERVRQIQAEALRNLNELMNYE